MSISRNGFQTFVNRNPPPGVVGDFASMNPRATALAGPGAFRSASTLNYLSQVNVPIVGSFAWGQGDFAYGQKPVGASVMGFVANELQTLTTFPPSISDPNMYRLAVQSGFPVTLFTHGDFWAQAVGMVNGFVSAGDTAYVRPYDGGVTNDSTAFSATGVQTAASTTLTVSAVTKGALVPGMVITGSGVAANTSIVVQLTGTPGGAGTYTVSNSTGFSSTTITSAAVDSGFKFMSTTVPDATSSAASVAAGTGVLTVGGSITGTLAVGQNVTGTGVPANLFIQAQLTGTPGGAGTYQLNTIGPAIASTAMTFSEGKLAKISRTY